MEDKILSLYAGGVSQKDISEQIKSLYDVEISPELVSKISERIMPEVTAWQLRFVLVEYNGTQSILASTDLTVSPLDIIQLYSYRFRIEYTFRELKQEVGGFSYHFWTKALPRLNHFKKKTDPDPLSQVTNPYDQKRIFQTVRATQMYTLMASIAMGILQALSIDFSYGVFHEPLRYQRTPANRNPSEANMMFCLRQRIFSLLARHAHNDIPHFILSAQSGYEDCGRDSAA